MPIQTRAFEFAAKRGWSIAELSRRSGLSRETLFKLRTGERQLGARSIDGLLRAFPDLTYADLFVPAKGSRVRQPRTRLQSQAA